MIRRKVHFIPVLFQIYHFTLWQGWKLGKFSGAAPAPQSDGAEPAVRADLKEPSRSRSMKRAEPTKFLGAELWALHLAKEPS